MMRILKVVFSTLLAAVLVSCTTAKNSSRPMERPKKVADSASRDGFIAGLLATYPQYFDTLLRQNEKWRIQIIYTQIDRQADNKPVFTQHIFNADPSLYFYPASTVKMPAAVLALQKLNDLKVPGLTKYSTLITGAAAPGQTAVFNDPTSADGRPSIAQYIRKIFLVSDNDAYNRLYEFLGQEYLNTKLHDLGFGSAQLLHRLSIPLSEEQNRTTNPVTFYDTTGRILYQQPLVRSHFVYEKRRDLVGKAYMQGDQKIAQPFDFSAKNRISLADLHHVLQRILFPETVAAKNRFHLTDDDYRFLYRYMSMRPRESAVPGYDTLPDAYVKFLLYGGGGPIRDSSIRVFNKVGDAYGFLQDAAYIADFEKGVEFMLSASIFCASDGVINYEGTYEYNTVGFPFLKHLGEVFYQYELGRKKKHVPDLSKFRVVYTRPEE